MEVANDKAHENLFPRSDRGAQRLTSFFHLAADHIAVKPGVIGLVTGRALERTDGTSPKGRSFFSVSAPRYQMVTFTPEDAPCLTRKRASLEVLPVTALLPDYLQRAWPEGFWVRMRPAKLITT